MRYLIRNPLLLIPIKCIDFFLRKARFVQRPIKKILICNLAHFGDVVIASRIISPIKKRYPNAKIGILTSSACKTLLPADFVHSFDHFKHDRSDKSLFHKLLNHIKQRRKVIQDLKHIDYDIAIDTYPYFGNAIPILYKVKIPKTIGFTSAGFGKWLTHPVDFEIKENDHISESYHLLLKHLQIENAYLDYHLKPLPGKPALSKPYIIIHPGAGEDIKKWPINHWVDLIKQMRSLPYEIILTGKGDKEARDCKYIQTTCSWIHNFCNRLSLEKFLSTVASAKFIVCVDSFIVHLASSYSVQCYSISNGIYPKELWQGLSPKHKTISFKQPCSPCYKKKGCKSMKCIKSLSAKDILIAMDKKIHLL